MFLFYKPSLERLGIGVTVRPVDEAQYENRLRSWDFDIITDTWPQSLSPGNEQRGYWGSQAADQSGSHNLIGIKNPAVDALIDQVIFAKSRADLVAATKALDRVLLWNHYVVPQWTSASSAPRAGTDLAGRRRCRQYGIVASRRSGGGTRKRRRRPATGVKAQDRGLRIAAAPSGEFGIHNRSPRGISSGRGYGFRARPFRAAPE